MGWTERGEAEVDQSTHVNTPYDNLARLCTEVANKYNVWNVRVACEHDTTALKSS